MELLIFHLQPSHETSFLDLILTDYERDTAAFASQYKYPPPPPAYNYQPRPYPDPSIQTAEQIAACYAAPTAWPRLDQDTVPASALQSPVGSSNSRFSARGPYLVAGRASELQRMAGTMIDLVERSVFACNVCGEAYKRKSDFK